MYVNRCCNSGRRNVIKKEAEKMLKYKSLVIGMQCMWNLRAKVMPIIIEANGTVLKSFRHYLSNVPGRHETEELQDTAVFDTALILRKVLMQ
jgi:hypothetical protein